METSIPACDAAKRSAMALTELLHAAGLSTDAPGAAEISVRGVTDDSRRIRPGWLFVAVPGTTVDGHRFVRDALASGACAVITQQPVPLPAGVASLLVDDSRSVLARLAMVFAGVDQLQNRGLFRLIGVTGTNGKTTTCYLIRSILAASGLRTALLGTITYDLYSRQLPAPMTTPPPTQLAEHLAEAARAGVSHVVMEASSHALHQRRLDGLTIAVGVFTNLSGDHLDYHGDMAQYLLAKKRLFDRLSEQARAVVNADDPATAELLGDCPAPQITYGLNGLADVRASIHHTDLIGSRFELTTPTGVATVELPLIGQHNVRNALASAAVALAMNVDLDTIQRGLAAVGQVPGRLQRAGSGAEPITVLVDYAHTDDALQNVLASLQPLKQRRIITVFGCGGDRDRTKRPRMGRVATSLSDWVVVTNDNPRTEKPEAIIDQIVAGVDAPTRRRLETEPNRRRAIERAVEMAQEGDLVLIAGKGHENYQDTGSKRIAFDDLAAASQAMARRFGDGV
ncbi:MAG TPA: UDP-N-acetylmuramoyl-L-alanyl-D-glutamate--2,6-diaminopimelate ligase [Phycisphaerae bacterium]|nr:UDP-N-acetylmuramoyl-L-alanyl-D-glutamate--2,6-diaminopimelate ligase [Phycisphaerae bacterium]